MILTTSQIVLVCQQLSSLGPNQAGLQASDILTFANLAMSDVLADVLKNQEEYLIYRDSIPISQYQEAIRIPYRAIGSSIRHLWFEDAAGNRSKLEPKFFENLEDYTTNDYGDPEGFYLQGNAVMLLPPTDQAGNLVVAYPFRPNSLVDQTQVAQVTAIDYPNNTVTINNNPLGTTGQPNFATNTLVDFIDHRSGNGIVYYDLNPTVNGNQVTFANPIPNVIVGNWLTLANQSPVPMVPEELHPLLLELTVYRIEVLRGMAQRIKAVEERVKLARQSAQVFLSQRVVSKPRIAGGGNPFMPQRFF